ncbi:MAG: hypothetical protein OEW67_04905 [Cyclobacteriaceae bacterium]|nr:hypothetical protein [Cyclobacteriaceae bacterium]
MNKLKFLLIIVIIHFSIVGNAQLTDTYTYTKEFKYGINKNTYGGLIGGVIIKHSLAVSSRMFATYGVEFMNITHPQEYGSRSQTGNIYKFGKMNTFYSLRPQYGRDLILFRKAPQQGAQIIAMLAVGPSIGIVAPYYLDTGEASGAKPYDPNNPTHTINNPDQILGTGGVLQGVLTDPSIVFGSHAKVGLSFEFGVFKKNVTGFEVGFLVDGYAKEIEIIDGAKSIKFLPTSFITVFWGSRR